MNELQRLLREKLPSDLTLLNVKRGKSSIKGRPSHEILVYIRDNVTGRKFEAAWQFANDLKLTSEHTIALMTKGLVEDLHNFRRNNS
jgi:hypothetical protein